MKKLLLSAVACIVLMGASQSVSAKDIVIHIGTPKEGVTEECEKHRLDAKIPHINQRCDQLGSITVKDGGYDRYCISFEGSPSVKCFYPRIGKPVDLGNGTIGYIADVEDRLDFSKQTERSSSGGDSDGIRNRISGSYKKF